MKSIWLFLGCIPLFSMEERPWFGNLYEVEIDASYAYSFFHKVNRGKPSLRKTWQDHLATLNIGSRIEENWSFEAEIQGDAASRRSFGYSSIALQGRYLCLDDVVGDAISMAIGMTLRQTSKTSLHQLSTPYHAPFTAELHSAFGKEWVNQSHWIQRLFVFGAFGKGNRGASWWRADCVYLNTHCDRVEWSLFLLGYFGCGNKQSVPTSHFHGWSQIAHSSLDFGMSLRFFFIPWGSCKFAYVRRLYAHCYPERANFFIASYELPFSLF